MINAILQLEGMAMLGVTTSNETARVATGFVKYTEIRIMKCEITPPVFGNVQIDGIRFMYWKDCDNHVLAHAIACLAVRDILHGAVYILSDEKPLVFPTLNTIQHITGPAKRMVEIPEDDEPGESDDREPRFEEITVIETTSVIDAEIKLDVGRHNLEIRLANADMPANVASTPDDRIVIAAARHAMDEICILIDSYVPELMRTIHANKDDATRIAKNQPLPHGVAVALGISEAQEAS